MEKRYKIAQGLFVVYLVLLVWLILLKLQFSFTALQDARYVNFIPFYYTEQASSSFHISEVMNNLLVFAPFGIFLGILKNDTWFLHKIIGIAIFSLALETAQFAFAIGRADITDVISNTLGGMLGILLYAILLKIFKNKKKLDGVLTTLAGIFTFLVIGLIAVVIVANWNAE